MTTQKPVLFTTLKSFLAQNRVKLSSEYSATIFFIKAQRNLLMREICSETAGKMARHLYVSNFEPYDKKFRVFFKFVAIS